MPLKKESAVGGNQTTYLYSLKDDKIIQSVCQESLLSKVKELDKDGIKLSELKAVRPFSVYQIKEALKELERMNLIKVEKRYPHRGRPSIWIISA